jgi:hypothetical protein
MGTIKKGPRFAIGDRVFTYYDMKWGNIAKIHETQEVKRQGEPTGEFDTWYDVAMDDGSTGYYNDGGTMGWDMARIIPPDYAQRYWPQYPDPKPDDIELLANSVSVVIGQQGEVSAWVNVFDAQNYARRISGKCIDSLYVQPKGTTDPIAVN